MGVYFSLENTILGNGKNVGNHSHKESCIMLQIVKEIDFDLGEAWAGILVFLQLVVRCLIAE